MKKRNLVHKEVEVADSKRQKTEDLSQSLPIAAHKTQILQKLADNKVVIISGDTGCGKTTHVPKYLLEYGRNHNKDINIICT